MKRCWKNTRRVGWNRRREIRDRLIRVKWRALERVASSQLPPPLQLHGSVYFSFLRHVGERVQIVTPGNFLILSSYRETVISFANTWRWCDHFFFSQSIEALETPSKKLGKVQWAWNKNFKFEYNVLKNLFEF